MKTNGYAKAFFLVKVMETLATGWFSGTYVLFLLDHELSLAQANSLNVAFMLTNLILTVPFGYLADKVGRRVIFVLGQIIWGLGMLIYGLGTTFSVFLCAEIIGAVGNALMFGTLDSWLRLHLEEEGKTHQVIAWTSSMSTLATIPTAVLGVAIGEVFGRGWPWIFAAGTSFVSAFLSSIIVFRLKEHPLPQSPNDRRKLILKEFRQHITDGRSLLFLIAVSMGVAIGIQSFNMFWSPIFRDLSGASWWLGWLWAGIAIASALGNWLSGTKFIRGRVGSVLLILPLVVIGLSMIAISGADDLSVFVWLFLLHEVGRGFLRPVEYSLWNRPVGHTIRSTVNSVRQAAMTFGAAIGLLWSGALSDHLPPLEVWKISGQWMLIIAVLIAVCRVVYRKGRVWNTKNSN